MARYLEVKISGVVPEVSDLLTALLSGMGFDSFSEEGTAFNAYIPVESYDENQLREIMDSVSPAQNLSYEVHPLEEKNWNAEWERNFEPVEIDEKCFIRAPFHEPRPDLPFDIIIEPKMSFGTAHHETTWQMVSEIMKINMSGRRVLDMGCGTAVLAILASMLGAEEVVAIDNDPWAYENALENVQRNNRENIRVIQGGQDAIPSERFHMILANINRNILLEQIPFYAAAMEHHGLLLVSGFYEDDLPAIKECAENEGLNFRKHRQKNRWVVAQFLK